MGLTIHCGAFKPINPESERWWGSDAFARIALDGSSQKFIGMQLFEPGSTMMIVPKVQSELDLLPTNKKPKKAEMATPRKPPN